MVSDKKIQKSILIRAPRAKVWQALADARQFGKWFRVTVNGEFTPGARIEMTSTYPGHEGTKFHVDIEEMEEGRLLSWRWHPGGPKLPGHATTLVRFELDDQQGGTLLMVEESGFERIPEAHRGKAFDGNEKGWTLQMENVERYVREGN